MIKSQNPWSKEQFLYCAYLVDTGLQSTTIRSYVSAIKSVLRDDDYEWEEGQVLITTLTHVCKVMNDRVFLHRLITLNLLEVILFEVERVLPGQYFLVVLYRALFALAYNGLFRIGELSVGNHPVQAHDVFITTNKRKMLLTLRTSKTHGENSRPQKIKIMAQGAPGGGEKIFALSNWLPTTFAFVVTILI